MSDNALRNSGSRHSTTRHKIADEKRDEMENPGSTGGPDGNAGRDPNKQDANPRAGSDNIGSRDLDMLTESKRNRNFRD